MNDTIFRMAEMLGVAANELIGYYVQRAPLEWVDVWLSGGIATMFLVISIALIRFGVKRDDDEVIIPGAVLFILALIVGGTSTAIEFTQAYKASKAPQAYAVDQILNHLND